MIDRRAGDVGGLVGGEEQHGVRHVVRRAEAAERHRALHRLDELGRAVPAQRLGHDVAGLDAVDGDAERRELDRRGADQAVDAGLGGGVVAMARAGDARAGDRARSARCGRSAARASPACGLEREEAAAEVDREHPVPLLDRDVRQQRQGIDAGVLDQDVDPAEARERRLRPAGRPSASSADVGRRRTAPRRARPAARRSPGPRAPACRR